MSESLRVGILHDMSSGPPGPSDIGHWLRLAVDELRQSGQLDAEVEFVDAFGLGLPSGTAAAVEDAFRELDGAGVLVVIGPAIGDNALVATPLAEAARLPTINWAGSERARGEYMFQLQVGSHEDEACVLAEHLAARGLARTGVVYDRSPIGERYLAFYRNEAAVRGLAVAVAEAIDPLVETAQEQAQRLADAEVDAVLYLGLGHAAEPLAVALSEIGWQGERLMTSAGIRGYQPDFARRIDGWIYVDLYAEDNRTLQSLRERYAIPAKQSLAAAKGYDLGRLLAWGLARAPEPTREGVLAGLEQVKYLPAAEGREGTLLGFGHRDRGALHGSYLVLRQWRDGETLACG